MASLTLGHVRGIPVRMQWSALLLPTVLGVMFASGRAAGADAPPAAAVLAGLVVGAGLLLSLLLHELAHAVVAHRNSIGVTAVTLWAFGGVAELGREAERPGVEARIAAAGPATSVATGAAFGGLGLAAALVGLWAPVVTALAWLAVANGVLAVFNLLPAAPLDGGRLLRAAVWSQRGDRTVATLVASRAGQMLGWGLVGVGVVEFAVTGRPLALWTALIGWFVASAAGRERAETLRRQQLGDLTVGAAMAPVTASLPDWLSVQAFLDRVADEPTRDAYLVQDFGGELSGVVTLGALAAVPVDDRDTTRVRQVSASVRDLVTARPDEPLVDVVERMARQGQSVVPVLDGDDVPVGTLTAADVARAARVGALRTPRRPATVT